MKKSKVLVSNITGQHHPDAAGKKERGVMPEKFFQEVALKL
ncbi:MAG: hypothetical protein WCI90_11395 [Chlorobium sp.]